jgi:hypothetical protein
MLANGSLQDSDSMMRQTASVYVREPWTTPKYDPRAEARLSRSQGAPGTDRPDAVTVAGSLLELVRFAVLDPQPWRFTIALPGQASLGSHQIAELAREWDLSEPSVPA